MTTPIMTDPASIDARLRKFGVVDAAVETHGADGADALNARFTAGDGEPAVDYHIIFANLGGELRSARDAMITANDAHVGVLARIVGLRKERDTLNKELSRIFKKARHTLENLAEPDQGFELLAVSGRSPRDPTGLVRQVRVTVGFLATPKAALPDPGLGITVDLTTMAARLGTDADGLDAVLTTLDRERKVAQATRQAKNDAIAAYDRTFRYVTSTLVGFFHLAGLHELAERVRPSTPRPGRPAEDGGPADVESDDRADDVRRPGEHVGEDGEASLDLVAGARRPQADADRVRGFGAADDEGFGGGEGDALLAGLSDEVGAAPRRRQAQPDVGGAGIAVDGDAEDTIEVPPPGVRLAALPVQHAVGAAIADPAAGDLGHQSGASDGRTSGARRTVVEAAHGLFFFINGPSPPP